MNTEMMLKVADALENESLKEYKIEYNQIYTLSSKDYRNPKCGTNACIAGWSVLLEDMESPANEIFSNRLKRLKSKLICLEAQKILGLSYVQKNKLFDVYPENFCGISPKFAAAVIRDMVARNDTERNVLPRWEIISKNFISGMDFFKC